MANLGDRRLSGNRIAEKFVPASDWTQDAKGNYLYLDLPGIGFKEEDVMVALAYPGYVTVSGERKVNDDKCIYFAQALRLPENLDKNKTSQNFDDDMLCLTFLKRVRENNENGNPAAEENAQEKLINDENQRKHDGHGHAENEEQSKQTDDHVASVHKEMRKKGSELESGINLVKNNIILTVVLAFLFGVFVSQMFESNGQ